MKRLMILLAVAGLVAGCARHRETSQGGASYDSTGSSMGTNTNQTNSIQAPTQGGTQQGTEKPAPGGSP